MLILFSRVVFLNILIQKSAKLFGNVVPSQCHMVLTIHIDRSLRFFERTWKRDTYICVTGFPRTVHNAPHHRHVHLFYSRIALFPDRHHLTNVDLDLISQLLKVGALGPTATRTRGDLTHKAPDPEDWQDLLRNRSNISPVW